MENDIECLGVACLEKNKRKLLLFGFNQVYVKAIYIKVQLRKQTNCLAYRKEVIFTFFALQSLSRCTYSYLVYDIFFDKSVLFSILFIEVNKVVQVHPNVVVIVNVMLETKCLPVENIIV